VFQADREADNQAGDTEDKDCLEISLVSSYDSLVGTYRESRSISTSSSLLLGLI